MNRDFPCAINPDNMIVFIDALDCAKRGENPSNAIERQEKRGQAAVVANKRLPKATNHCSGYQSKNDTDFTRQQYEKMGIKIIDDYDDLFWNVQLPEGWDIKATSHSMWNELLDDKGRKRASFFYKAAFYDRDAFINFETRYTTCVDHILDYSDVGYDEWRLSPCIGHVKDCGVIIYSTAQKPSFENYLEQEKKTEKPISKELEKYMKEHYPDYKNVHAYWDN